MRSVRSSHFVVLPTDLRHVYVDTVECFEHDDCIAADYDHTDPHFLSSGLLFERVVKDDVQVDLRGRQLRTRLGDRGANAHRNRAEYPSLCGCHLAGPARASRGTVKC